MTAAVDLAVITEPGPERTIRLGFIAESLDAAMKSLEKLGAVVLRPPAITQRGYIAVALDPEGREVELNEPLKSTGA
ncbi:MAG: hypothetical protein L0220_31435 [Acidobacteria bacterium]|nr:hypothetical protein [Acidobacteriota bacterium]